MNNSLILSTNNPKIIRVFDAKIFIDRNHHIKPNTLITFSKYTHVNTESRNTKNLQRYFVRGYILKGDKKETIEMYLYQLNKRLFVDKENKNIYKLFTLLHTQIDSASRMLPLYIATRNEEIFSKLSSLKFKLLTNISSEKGMFVFEFNPKKFEVFVKSFELMKDVIRLDSKKEKDFYFSIFCKNRLILEHLSDEKIDELVRSNMFHEIISEIKIKSVNDFFRIDHTSQHLDLKYNFILVANSEFKNDHSFVPRNINLVSKFTGREGSIYRGIHDIV